MDVGPERSLERVSRDELGSRFREQAKQLEHHWLDVHCVAGDTQGASLDIQAAVTEAPDHRDHSAGAPLGLLGGPA